MANGRTYGRFRSSGGVPGRKAHEVMAMAKRQGAEVRGLEAYYDFMAAVDKEARAAEIAQSRGAKGGSIGSLMSSIGTPMLLGALGLGTGGIGNILLGAALGTGISSGSVSLGDALSRQWAGGGGLDFKGKNKLMSGNLNYRDFLRDAGGASPYGARFIDDLSMRGSKDYKKEVQDKKDYVDILKGDRFMNSIMSGILAAGQVGAVSKAKPELLKDTFWGGKSLPFSSLGKAFNLKPDFGGMFSGSPKSPAVTGSPSIGSTFGKFKGGGNSIMGRLLQTINQFK